MYLRLNEILKYEQKVETYFYFVKSSYIGIWGNCMAKLGNPLKMHKKLVGRWGEGGGAKH